MSDPRLDRHTKLQILRRWRDDLQADEPSSGSDAEEDAPSTLQRVDKAIHHLSGNGR